MNASTDYLKTTFGPQAPGTAIVLGSGLGPLADQIEDARSVDYAEIPGFFSSTVEGHAGKLIVGSLEGVDVVAMKGRVHLYEGHSAQEVVAPLRALLRWGVKRVLISNAAGGIQAGMAPGDLMLIRDHLNLTGQNALYGPNVADLGPRFVDMSFAYTPSLQAVAREQASALGQTLKEGVYAGLLGPSYETPAEINMLERMGADAVGMSTVHEVIAARHAGAEVLGISCISNLAAGRSPDTLSHEEVKEVADKAQDRFVALVRAIVRESACKTTP